MGTNFYLVSKQTCDYVFTEKYHIGKRSGGWLPHFQIIHINKWDFPSSWGIEDCTIDSVRKLKEFYMKNRDYFFIADEYGTPYAWSQFKSEFIDWDGGKCDHPRHHRHLDVRIGSEFLDEDGYEWCDYEFF